MTKSDWKKCKLGEVVNVKGGKRLPAGHVLVQNVTNHPYLRVRDLTQRFPLKGNLEYITEDTFSHISRYIVKENDVVLSIVGSIGLVALINKNLNNISLTENAVRLFSTQVFPLFLYYYLLSPFGQAEIAKNTVGAVQAKLPIYGIQNIDIALPSLEEQKRIAGILGALDDKIELLQKQNKTLEDMAKAIFKSWFVDFDVVHAKANLEKRRRSPTETLGDDTLLTKADIMREYHLTDELYDLFPSDFENSSLGPIPSGWQVKILGDFFPIKTGKKDANVASKIGQYPFFSCAQNILWTDEYSFDDTALLLAGNGDFNLKWYRGKFEAYQRTYVLIPNNAKDLPFLYYAMQFFLDKITLGSRGSVIKFITKGMIENYKLVIPEEHLWEYMSELLGQWTDKIESNLKQIQTLTELRDTLLPPLISGKIRV